jgi:hypothetical protein
MKDDLEQENLVNLKENQPIEAIVLYIHEFTGKKKVLSNGGVKKGSKVKTEKYGLLITCYQD